MEHFGLICPPLPSHVTGMTAIARELVLRGHRATMFNIADARGLTLSEGTEFVPVGTEDHPEGSLAEFSQAVARLKGIPALRFRWRPSTRNEGPNDPAGSWETERRRPQNEREPKLQGSLAYP